MAKDEKDIKYCLYARKSSESDERQARSIESQLSEMQELAEKEGLNIVEVKKESHSAKISGTRPVFLEILKEINLEKFNGILAWSPDRLSRNAGDLGSLVDLMDRKKLVHIKTYSQSFSNNPNEKFLLMILCSQAKLENDNRSLHVQRGIRNKCEMGWRPCPAPLGYINYSHEGTKKIMLDKEVAPYIKELFQLVAECNYSGRDLRDHLKHDKNLRKLTGKKIPLSMIYSTLKNTFYYGEFEYPRGSGKWYKGAHEPIIEKWLFDKVQKKLITSKKAKWGSIFFLFKHAFKCAYCGANFVGEQKVKRLKSGTKRTYTYYRCSRQIDPNCEEPYVNENELIGELINYVGLIENKRDSNLYLNSMIRGRMDKYTKLRESLLASKDIHISEKVTFTEYLKYTLYNGTKEEKLEAVETLKLPLFIHNKTVYTHPLG